MVRKGTTAAAPEAAAPQTESTKTTAATKKDLAVVKGNGSPATAITVSVKVPKGAKERGLTPEQWQVLREVIFPGAYDETVKDRDGKSMFDEADVDLAVLVAYDYCQARKLDIMKKPLHIVPMWDGKRRKMVPKHWPAISELRITASRTRCYAGKDAPKFGPLVEMQFEDFRLEIPESCTVTVYKIVQDERCPFEGTVWWNEAYGRRGKTVIPNAMWQKRKFGQLAKCAEAEALRCAFPEELGGVYTAEEMRGQEVESMIDITPATTAADEPAPTFDLVLMDGEIEEHPDPESWVGALGDLVKNHYPVASADAVRGNWETNAPMFDEPEFADYHTSAQPALQSMFMAIYGKLSLARDLANDAKPETEKTSGEPATQEASGETSRSETTAIDWLKWVSWFAAKVKELGKEDAQELVLQHGDDLALMKARKTKGATADWKRMEKLLADLGLELGAEDYD